MISDVFNPKFTGSAGLCGLPGLQMLSTSCPGEGIVLSSSSDSSSNSCNQHLMTQEKSVLIPTLPTPQAIVFLPFWMQLLMQRVSVAWRPCRAAAMRLRIEGVDCLGPLWEDLRQRKGEGEPIKPCKPEKPKWFGHSAAHEAFFVIKFFSLL